MKFEYSLFNKVDEFMTTVSYSPSMGRQIATVFLYEDFVVTYSQVISGEKGESLWFFSMVRGTLPTGLVEFDLETKKITEVTRPINPDRIYFNVTKQAR